MIFSFETFPEDEILKVSNENDEVWKLLFTSFFSFSPLSSFLSDTFLAPLLFALEQDEKPYFHTDIVTRFGLQLDLLQVDLFARFEYTANRK